MNISREPVPMDITYFREDGIHAVETDDGTDYIATFPKWATAAEALRSEMPTTGNVVLPELIAAPEDITKLAESHDLLADRLEFAKNLTRGTDAILHLGIPTYKESAVPEKTGVWYNSVISLENGRVDRITHKKELHYAEEFFGIKAPQTDTRRAKNGNAVMICVELHEYAHKLQGVMPHERISKLFVPAAWAMPQEINPIALERSGGSIDQYYKDQLSGLVGRFTLNYLPDVQTIILSDRSVQPGLKPYSAVIRRRH